MFIVKKTNGQYVSDPNTNPNGSSYSRNLRLAKVYNTKQEADSDCCGNERVEALLDQVAITN